MARRSVTEFPYDSSHFTSLQLHPSAATRLAFAGWARWTAEHAVAFPTMIREYGAGFAVMGVRLDYHEPFTFLDGERLTLTTTSRLLRHRSLMETVTRITAHGRHPADTTLLCRALSVDVGRAMAAQPGTIPPEIAERYRPEELCDDDTFTDRLGPLLGRLSVSSPGLARADCTRLIDRQVCEAADQWCFTEVTGLLATSRQHLIDTRAEEHPILRQGLSRPLDHVEFRLTRLLLLHDRATIETTCHQDGNRLVFAHRIVGENGYVHGEAAELLEPAP
ncbi:hypothetical protein ACFQVC_32225 [Streptomyces monticola]|uniref:Thioesterase n=1 Tax=Streptomyces monticola TaxID=2666263 RepID=A0ABW2JSF0_9ACTN